MRSSLEFGRSSRTPQAVLRRPDCSAASSSTQSQGAARDLGPVFLTTQMTAPTPGPRPPSMAKPSIVSTGHIRASSSRSTQALQAATPALLYRRKTPKEFTAERRIRFHRVPPHLCPSKSKTPYDRRESGEKLQKGLSPHPSCWDNRSLDITASNPTHALFQGKIDKGLLVGEGRPLPPLSRSRHRGLDAVSGAMTPPSPRHPPQARRKMFLS